MASVINAYSVSLGLDASSFIDGAKVTRSEMRQLTREIEAAQTPMEKFAVQQARWKKQVEEGVISQDVYNRLVAAHGPVVEKTAIAYGPYIAALTSVGATLTSAAAAGVAFVTFLRSQQNEIDDTADAAQRLGLSFNEMTSLEFAFKEGGGIDAATVETSLKKMQINLAKAVDGDATLRDAFARLGLDAGQLIGQGPQQAILSIADKMQGVSTHAERLKLAMEIFGKSGADLASTLGSGAASLEEAVAFQQHWNSLTDQQVAMVGANNDAWDRIAVIIEGISNTLAAEAAPAMLMIARDVLAAADSFSSVDQYMKNAVTNAVVMAGYVKDYSNYLGFLSGTKEKLELGTSMKWYKELEETRRSFTEAGRESAAKREQERQTLLMKEMEDKEKTKEADAEKRRIEAEQRRLDAIEKEENRRAELALKNAEKYFEDERKRQMKLREDTAKGPETFEVGSAGFAKMLADGANAAMAQVQVDMKPTDEELLTEARKQLAEAQAHTMKMESMVTELRNIKQAVADNTIVRAR